MTVRPTVGRFAVVAVCLLLASTAGLWGCNEHPVDLSNTDGIYSFYPDPPTAEAEKVDILWVIDNSGTMCQEQQELRNRFGAFIEKFGEHNIDFNIGVTTTHMESNSREPVAMPGRLQATPQPVPYAFEGCLGEEGEASDPMDGFQPIRTNIDASIACTKDASQWDHLRQVTDEEIRCATDASCEETSLDDLFPRAQNGESPYREIPLVLSASDPAYQTEEGLLDLEKLERDFACMSFVGTQGNAFEKGLGAAVEAVSPEMTGGTVENPTDPSAPNHGLLREAAEFAVIFLTDENDCTHDGNLNQCHSSVCEYANHPDLEDSPLISPEELSDQMIANLASSKGIDSDEFDRDQVVVASLHGQPKRYGGEDGYPEQMPPFPDVCNEEVLNNYTIRTACYTPEFGTAYSGDRYERFMRTFSEDRIYPRPNDKDVISGLVCSPDRFNNYMSEIAGTIAGSFQECIDRKPQGCDGGENTCGDFAFGDEAAQCVPFGQTGESFCSSSVQVRLFPGERTFEELQAHEYCIAESLDSRMTPGGCVVDQSKYDFADCVAVDDGFAIEWNEERWFEKIRGFEVEVVVSSGGGTSR